MNMSPSMTPILTLMNYLNKRGTTCSNISNPVIGHKPTNKRKIKQYSKRISNQKQSNSQKSVDFVRYDLRVSKKCMKTR